VVTTIHHDDFQHPLGVDQDYIDNGLRETTVNEYVKQTYRLCTVTKTHVNSSSGYYTIRSGYLIYYASESTKMLLPV
jgi:hypothetical protein